MRILDALLINSPTILFGLLFFWSFWREPRQFRNGLFLSLFLICLGTTCMLYFDNGWLWVVVAALIDLMAFAGLVFLFSDTFIVIRREGFSLVALLPAMLAATFLVCFIGVPMVMILFPVPFWFMMLTLLLMLEGFWFFLSFGSLLVYSTFYRLLPRRRTYDYIIIHGAGLQGDKPTPLLRGRIDKAVSLWEKQGKRGKFIASGGQGSDEVVSEAEAIRNYLVEERGVPADAVIMEDKSTTTMENLKYSMAIMDKLGPNLEHSEKRSLNKGGYRCALVTSDYHVFRACEYAHNLKLKADGVGSHTKGYYWPAAFIREFVAVTRAHLWPYYVIAAVCVIIYIVAKCGMAFF